MSRLIDADALMEALNKSDRDARTEADIQGYCDGWNDVVEIINEHPTAYDVEKVMAELEQQAEQYRNRGFEHEQKGFSTMADKYYGKQCSYLHAIDIVKRGGVE
jgi:hypothetical protein